MTAAIIGISDAIDLSNHLCLWVTQESIVYLKWIGMTIPSDLNISFFPGTSLGLFSLIYLLFDFVLSRREITAGSEDLPFANIPFLFSGFI